MYVHPTRAPQVSPLAIRGPARLFMVSPASGCYEKSTLTWWGLSAKVTFLMASAQSAVSLGRD